MPAKEKGHSGRSPHSRTSLTAFQVKPSPVMWRDRKKKKVKIKILQTFSSIYDRKDFMNE